MSEGSTHIGSIDVLKGILIIGIVFLHLALLTAPLDQDRNVVLPLQCAYLGLMAFFMISGYFYRPNRSLKENLDRRAKQLLVALVASSVILSVLMYAWMTVNGFVMPVNDLIDSIIYGLSFYDLGVDPSLSIERPICEVVLVNYFMWTMLCAFVFFYATAKYVVTDVKRLLAAVIPLLILQCVMTSYFRYTMPFYLHLVPISLAFMYIGAYLPRYRLLERIDDMRLRDLRYWAPFIVCTVATAVIVYIFPNYGSFDLMKFGGYGGLSVFPFMVQALTMFVVWAYIATIFSRMGAVSRMLAFAGRHSLAVAFLHGFVAKALFVPFFDFDRMSIFPADAPIWSIVVVFVLTVAIILTGCYLRDIYRQRKETS